MKYGFEYLKDKFPDIDQEQLLRNLKANVDYCEQLKNGFSNNNTLFEFIGNTIRGEKKHLLITYLNSRYNMIVSNELDKKFSSAVNQIEPSKNYNSKKDDYIRAMQSIAYLCTVDEAEKTNKMFNIDIDESNLSDCAEVESDYLAHKLDIWMTCFQVEEEQSGQSGINIHRQLLGRLMLSAFYKSLCVEKENYFENFNNYVSPENQSIDFFPKMFSLSACEFHKTFIITEDCSVLRQLHKNIVRLQGLISWLNNEREKNGKNIICLVESDFSYNGIFTQIDCNDERSKYREAGQLISEWVDVFASNKKIEEKNKSIRAYDPNTSEWDEAIKSTKRAYLLASGISAICETRGGAVNNYVKNLKNSAGSGFHVEIINDAFSAILRLLALPTSQYRAGEITIRGKIYSGGPKNDNDIDKIHKRFIEKISIQINAWIDMPVGAAQ